MPCAFDGPVLFIGSGPCRISQEIRANAFAHSCLAWLEERGAEAVVLDNDAAGVLAAPGREVLTVPLDAEGLSEAVDSVAPAAVWPACAGKEVQGLLLGVLEREGLLDRLPGGPGAWRAATDWGAFRRAAEAAGVEVPFGRVVSSIQEAADVAGEAGFPLFLSASRPRGGGGARIAYNHEELAAQAQRLLSWSLAGEMLAVRVHEKHPHCQVHLLRDSAGETLVLGEVEALGPLGVHISNSALVFPGCGIGGELRGDLREQARRLAEEVGLQGYAGVHFAVEPGGPAYAVGMRTRFGASSYILSLGLDLDLGRAAAAVAFGEAAREAVAGASPSAEGVPGPGKTRGGSAGKAGRGPDQGAGGVAGTSSPASGAAPAEGVPEPRFTAVSAPVFESDLFPGASSELGPHKVSTGRGVGLASTFEEAFLAAHRRARGGGPEAQCRGRGETTASVEREGAPAARDLFAEGFERSRGPDALGRVAGRSAQFFADVVASILQGHTLGEISGASGLSRHYLEKIASLVGIYRDLLRPGASREAAARALGAGFSPGEVAAAAGLEEAELEPPQPEIVERADPGGRRFVVCSPRGKHLGEADASDAILRGLAEAYIESGRGLVFAGWRSQLPLDLYFRAARVVLGEPRRVLPGELDGGGERIVYAGADEAEAGELAEIVSSAGARLAGPEPQQQALLSDRRALGRLLSGAGLVLKEGREAADLEEARSAAQSFGYPVMIRPRDGAERVAYDQSQLDEIISRCGGGVVERFLEDLAELAVVVLSDGEAARAAAVVEVLEEPGISSADCAGVLPPLTIPERKWRDLAARAERMVAAAGIRGLLTVRLGTRYDVAYYLSAAAPASREMPFAAFVLESDLLAAAAAIFEGEKLDQVFPERAASPRRFFIRQPIFPFERFPGADTVLSTSPRSSGDVLGDGENFSLCFARACRAAGRPLPSGGTVFVSLRDRDKREGMLLGRELKEAGFDVVATEGTARALSGVGVDARVVHRVSEGRPNVVDLIKNGEITMVIYTPAGRVPREDEVQIRTVAWGLGIPVITTIGEARAVVGAIQATGSGK